jgi:hypothetical protein
MARHPRLRRTALGAGGRHADDFLGAEVGGDEGQAGNPGRHRAPGQEEVGAVLYAPPQHEADAQHEAEVDDHDQPVDAR